MDLSPCVVALEALLAGRFSCRGFLPRPVLNSAKTASLASHVSEMRQPLNEFR
jgi:hypothetical protein